MSEGVSKEDCSLHTTQAPHPLQGKPRKFRDVIVTSELCRNGRIHWKQLCAFRPCADVSNTRLYLRRERPQNREIVFILGFSCVEAEIADSMKKYGAVGSPEKKTSDSTVLFQEITIELI